MRGLFGAPLSGALCAWIEPVPGDSIERKDKRRLFEQQPEVIQRWVRLKMLSKAPALARRYMRIRLPWTERRRHRELKAALDTIKDAAIRLERGGYEASLTICNIALYLLIAERDIQAVKIDALTHPDWWTRHLCGRVILLTLHEWDMDKVSGRRLKEALTEVNAPYPLVKEALLSLRAIRKIQQRARKELGHLRNATIAHRDPDALLQYRAIRDMDMAGVFNMAADFYSEVRRFTTCLPNLLAETTTLPSLFRQLAASEDRKKANA